MNYPIDGGEGINLHFSLPEPTLDALAAGSKRPSAEVEALIRAEAPNQPDAYHLHYEVSQTYRDVTIGQVAWVLTNA